MKKGATRTAITGVLNDAIAKIGRLKNGVNAPISDEATAEDMREYLRSPMGLRDTDILKIIELTVTTLDNVGYFETAKILDEVYFQGR